MIWFHYTSYTIHSIAYIVLYQQIHRHPVWPTMSGSFICGFVVLMEPFPLGGGLLLLGDLVRVADARPCFAIGYSPPHCQENVTARMASRAGRA